MLNSNSYRTPLENCFCVQKLSFADVPLKKCSEKFRKFDRKTPVLESVFEKETPTQVLSCKICEIFKNTFFKRTPFYGDCFCVFWKSGKNFSLQQLRKSHVGRQQLYRELHCRHPRGNFLKLIKQAVSVAFMGTFILNYTI